MDDRQKIDYAAKRMAEELARVLKAEPGKLTLPLLPTMAGELATEGWHETTTLSDLGRGVRTFIAGANGSRQVAAAGVELGKARAELHALKASLLELADTLAQEKPFSDGGPALLETPFIAELIRKRVGR